MQKSSARQDDGADLFWADQGVGRHGKVIDPALRSQLSFSGTHILLSKHFEQGHKYKTFNDKMDDEMIC